VSILHDALERAIILGARGAALVDRSGTAIVLAGEIDPDEAMPLAAYAMYVKKSPELAMRMFEGEILEVDHEDGRHVAVCIAKRQLFIVVVFGTWSRLDDVRALHREIEQLLSQDVADTDLPPWSDGGGNGGGGGGAGPAELALAEYGITMPRTRPRA
jgi:hypothetical protein